jgi:hypothetical protein
MIVVNTPFHAARSRRDCIGMCDALIATLKPREPIVGHATADGGPIDVRMAPRRADGARREAQ